MNEQKPPPRICVLAKTNSDALNIHARVGGNGEEKIYKLNNRTMRRTTNSSSGDHCDGILAVRSSNEQSSSSVGVVGMNYSFDCKV